MKFNLIYAFNRLCIAKRDKWLIAFRTKYKLFKYLVTPFGLVNALSLFQYFINNILHPYLDIFCTVYINNILVYSNNLAKYKKYINFVIKALCKASVQLDINKCKFHKIEVLYFGLIIFINSI